MGFYHEQSRSDRDTYVDVFLDNVRSDMVHNFDKEPTNNYGLPYDYTSNMHYGTSVSDLIVLQLKFLFYIYYYKFFISDIKPT